MTCFRSLLIKMVYNLKPCSPDRLDIAVACLLLVVILPVPFRAALVSAAIFAESVITDCLALVVLSDTSSVVRRRRVLPELSPLELAVDRASDVGQPHDGSDNAVGNLSFPGVPREAQTEATVDDTEGDDDASEPQMAVTPDHAARVLLEHEVVEETEEWLEEQQDEDDDADDRVRVVESSDLCRHVDADAEGRDEHQVAEDLAGGVDPDETAEGGDADQDTADWEEDDKGERCEDAVGGHEFGGVLSVTTEGNVVGVEASKAFEAGRAGARGARRARGARVASVI